jgi:hypothetical protein
MIPPVKPAQRHRRRRTNTHTPAPRNSHEDLEDRELPIQSGAPSPLETATEPPFSRRWPCQSDVQPLARRERRWRRAECWWRAPENSPLRPGSSERPSTGRSAVRISAESSSIACAASSDSNRGRPSIGSAPRSASPRLCRAGAAEAFARRARFADRLERSCRSPGTGEVWCWEWC